MQSGSAGDDDDKEEEEAVFLSPGALVDIANVKSKPELNGRAAKVIGFDEEKGRYLVELVDGGKEKVALKRKCLLEKVVVVLEGKKTGREEDAAFFQSPFEEEKRTKKQKVVEEDETKEKENIKVVDKNDDGSNVVSTVTAVEGDDRVRELARMLAGQPESASGNEHAAELLQQARLDRSHP